MTTIPQTPREYYEDFASGFSVAFQVPGLEAGDIVEFATRYDPQRFHVDENAAANTPFGGLIASGFQTVLLCFQPFCKAVLQQAQALGAPGIDRLQWKRPWYPGETLDVTVTLTDKRLSSGRNDRGYLNFRMTASVNGVPTLVMEWTVILLTREGMQSQGGTNDAV